MLAISHGEHDVVLGETNFDISKFYGHKQQKLTLPIRDEFFSLHCKISVVDLTQGPDVDVDVANVLKMEDPKRLAKISPEMRATISSQSKIHEQRMQEGGHRVELGHHVVSESSGHYEKQVEELEHKLKEAHKRGGGHMISEHEAGVENQNLHKQLEAKDEKIHHMEKKHSESDAKIHHLEALNHKLEEKIEHQQFTIKEHMHKMEEAAKLADHRAKEEMLKLEEIAKKHGGGGHHESSHHESSHHGESHHESSSSHTVTSTSVSLSLSYDQSHEHVISNMITQMKKMHDLDQHRIKELSERVKLLEHQAHVDYEREQRMIEEWEHAI